MRNRLCQILRRYNEGDNVSYAYDIFISVVAVLSISGLIAKVAESWNTATAISQLVPYVDAITVTILLFDYVMRWITFDIDCEMDGVRDREGKPLGWRAFILYPFTPAALIDLIALLPSLVTLPSVCTYLIVLRLFKVFRVLRSLEIIRKVFVREGRTLLSVLFVTLLYVLSVALLMYTIEPGTFADFVDAFYWSSTALATIGYGDISPQTEVGKVVNIVSAIVGVAVVALPSGIITGGYVAEARRRHEKGVRSKRGIKRGYSLSERIEDRALETHKAVKRRRLLGYFRSHPRVVRYALVIALCFALNALPYALFASANSTFSFDFWGTALCAFLLEPAAGIIVGFANMLFYAVKAGGVNNLLYVSADVAVALVFGVALSIKRAGRDAVDEPGRFRFGRPKVARDAAVLLAGALLVAMLQLVVSLLVDTDGSIAVYCAELYRLSGLAGFVIVLVGIVLNAALNLFIAYVIALVLVPLERRLRRLDARDDAAADEDDEGDEDDGAEQGAAAVQDAAAAQGAAAAGAAAADASAPAPAPAPAAPEAPADSQMEAR